MLQKFYFQLEKYNKFTKFIFTNLLSIVGSYFLGTQSTNDIKKRIKAVYLHSAILKKKKKIRLFK